MFRTQGVTGGHAAALGLSLVCVLGAGARAGAAVKYDTVALKGQPAPGAPAGVNYLFLGVPSLNNAGHVSYVADLTGPGVTGANEAAFFAGPFAAPQLVAREDDAAPGTPAGVRYSLVDADIEPNNTDLVITDAGDAAFRPRLIGTGVTTANDGALYAGPFAAPQLIAREGNAVPGMPAGVNYSFIENDFAVNDASDVSYFATVSGPGITTANDGRLFA